MCSSARVTSCVQVIELSDDESDENWEGESEEEGDDEGEGVGGEEGAPCVSGVKRVLRPNPDVTAAMKVRYAVTWRAYKYLVCRRLCLSATPRRGSRC